MKINHPLSSPLVHDIFEIRTEIFVHSDLDYWSLVSKIGNTDDEFSRLPYANPFIKILDNNGFRISDYSTHELTNIKVIVDGEYNIDTIISQFEIINTEIFEDDKFIKLNITIDKEDCYTFYFKDGIFLRSIKDLEIKKWKYAISVIMPFAKKVAASTMGIDIVAVKPMSLPTGKLYYMDIKIP